MRRNSLKTIFAIGLSWLWGQSSVAACGANDRTWDCEANNVQWHNATNWSGNNEPDDSTENAIIVSCARIARMTRTRTVACIDVQSGTLDARAGNTTITITGDYFRNPNSGALTIQASDSHTFDMAGTADQSFENKDTVNTLTISNASSTVTFTDGFSIRNALNLTGTSTTIKVDGDLTLEAGSTAFSIPSGITVEVASGKTLTLNEGVTVSGTLKMGSGSTLVIGNGKSLTVASGGLLQLNGSSGSAVTVKAPSAGNTFSMSLAGTLNASYWRFDRLDATGINVTGTIQAMDNGEFHFLANSGYAITLGAAATIPSTFDSVGFFDDDGHGNVQNFNASAYAGTSTTVNNWSGAVGDEANDNDPNCGGDPPGCVAWGAQAGTKLNVSDNTASGSPPTTIAESSADTLFATFQFTLNQASTATDITSVKLTMSGTASSSDISAVKVYKDDGAGTNCVYDAGTDTQIGSDLTLSGSPPTATVSITAGDVQTDSDSDPACIHVVTATTASATDLATIQFKINGTSDVVNSQSYDFSDTAGPPVSAGSSEINSSFVTNTWQGDAADGRFNRNANWQSSGFPNSGKSCILGSGNPHDTLIGNTTTVACLNATVNSGAVIDYNSTTNIWEIYGSLTVASSGVTWSNATSGNLNMVGANNQSMSLGTAFPGDMTINNTGSAGSNVVSVDGTSTVQGDLTVTGGVLSITNGKTLTVEGNLTVQTGAELEIKPGGTLVLANGSVLTVDSGGTLTMVGTSGSDATVTSTGASAAYTVVVNGTIAAQHYRFDHLGVAGVDINSGASIDSTHHLQDCTFAFPVNNSSTLLTLDRKVPSDNMDNCSFDLDGSAATGTTTIDLTNTTPGPQTTLTIDGYTGDLAGPGSQTDGTNYVVSWTGASNTITLTQEATSPSSLNAGSTYNMGRFGFVQKQAGASFVDTDITSLKLTLTGTGASSDIDEVKVYYDSDCDGASGTLIDSGTYTGNPASRTFTFTAGEATVPADNTTPEKRCLYVEYVIASGASDGKTLGVKIDQATDVVNDQSYDIDSGVSFPVTLGTEGAIVGANNTVWLGTTDTDWFTASNWSSGLPDATKDCEIDDVANDPVINGGSGTAICKSVTIGNGTVTLQNATSAVLEVNGSFSNTGTFTQNDGTLRFEGTANQQISSSSTISAVTFDKTGGGELALNGNVTVTTLTIPGGSSFELRIPSGDTLTLPNGLTIPAGTVNIEGGGRLEIGASQTLTVSGGTLQTSGTNDVYPQSTANKGTITRQGGSGTWSFSATSGTVDLTGFILDRLDANGLNISGTANLLNLDGGQFTNLIDSASTRVIQLNTSTAISESTATNVGFEWGAANDTNASSCCAPSTSQTYFLVHASACGSATLTFDQWFGDFWPGSPNLLDTEDKIHDQDDVGPTCQVTIAASASPVALTQFTATGYNGAVSVDWTTGSENNHAGFNVYRSKSLLGGYIQVNSELIRNFNDSTIFQGSYRYVDTNVENNTTYYYYIEDIAFNGSSKMHGPVFALPNVVAGTIPGTGSGVNEDQSDSGVDTGNAPTTGPIVNEGLIDLGNGVHIISQTASSLRIEVVPPAATYTVASWDASYKSVAIPGYVSTTVVGHPELVERVLMIEVEGAPTNASVTNENGDPGTVVNHKIQPAPTWAPDGGGVLQPTYAEDATAYALNANAPSSYYTLDPVILEVGGKRYVKITIHPLLYNAVSEDVTPLQKLVLDIGLDGNAWDAVPPSVALAASPSAVDGALRIKYDKTGLYEVTYDDLATAGVLGPFDGADTSQFRLYWKGVEQALEMDSTTGFFASGDKIRFYATYFRQIEDDYNEIVLTEYDLYSSGAALRVQTLDADPSGQPSSTQAGSFRRVNIEQDNDAILDRPYGDLVDRFIWRFLFAQKGVTPGAGATLTTSVNLPKLISDQQRTVRVKVYARGKGALSVNPVHNLGIYVNRTPFLLGTQSFAENDKPVMVQFDLPSYYFIDGVNEIQVQVQGDLVPDGDFDLVNIDRIEVEYDAFHEADSDLVVIDRPYLGEAVTATGFSSNAILAYDVSDGTQLTKLSNLNVIDPSTGTFNVQLAPHTGGSEDLGFRINVIEESAFLKPRAFDLGKGFTRVLRDTSNRYDMIILGHKKLINAAYDLVAHREAQGLRVLTVDIDQIYAEFSHGVKDSRSIRDFLLFARSNWTAPKPQYVLILGDATFDPRDRFGWGLDPEYMGVPFERGQFEDFGNDNWFVAAEDGSGLPTMAIGRLPTNNQFTISKYVEKLIAYETGEKAPTATESKRMTYIVDSSPDGEKFNFHADLLSAGMKSLKPETEVGEVSRDVAGSDAATNVQIATEFGVSPLVMTYLGHGAEDRWADSDVFANSHAQGLNNSRLPIVMALNCLNARFWQDDPDAKSLAESLVFNEQGGAVAFWGSTTMTPPTVQVALHNHFQEQLAAAINQHENKYRIGDFMLNSKVALGSSASTKDTLRSWTLIGDPAMKLADQAYADPPPAVTDSQNSEPSDSGGFSGCGTLGSGGSGTRGLFEVLFLFMILAAVRFGLSLRTT